MALKLTMCYYQVLMLHLSETASLTCLTLPLAEKLLRMVLAIKASKVLAAMNIKLENKICRLVLENELFSFSVCFCLCLCLSILQCFGSVYVSVLSIALFWIGICGMGGRFDRTGPLACLSSFPV